MGHHDLFFKQTFSIRENAVDFVKHTLPPELADGIDFSTLALEKGSGEPLGKQHQTKTGQNAGDPCCTLPWENCLEPRNPDFQV